MDTKIINSQIMVEENTNPIIVKQAFKVSKSEIWQAITEPAQMRQWFFENIDEFKPEVGFKTQFVVEANGKEFIHNWEIIDVIPEERITYDWRYENYKGQGEVIFDLTDTEKGCQLTLTNKGIESFPQDMPEFTRQSCRAGWEYFLNERLHKYLHR